MQTTTRRQRSLRKDKKGLSNIIIVVLSLVIMVVIVSNVILWSYQMNQFDWDKMQENIILSNVVQMTRSSWFVARSEYRVNKGSLVSGSYLDTRMFDGFYERFRESNVPRELDINGTFSIDLSTYPLAYAKGVEIQLRYAVDNAGEKWFLKAYNWTSRTYTDIGFNTTAGHTPSPGWNNYAINITGNWRSYVQNDGRMIVKIQDQFPDPTRTNFDIDFLGIRTVSHGTLFTFQNKSSRTVHFVSIWINNSTIHQKYDVDLFVNSGETFTYQRADIQLPNGQCIVKAISERGNSAIYTTG